MTQLYDEILQSAGLRVTQFSLLVALSRAGTATVQRLADLPGMDRTDT